MIVPSLLLFALSSTAVAAQPEEPLRPALTRLSLLLRQDLVSEDELSSAGAALQRGEPPRDVYEAHVQKWLTGRALARVLDPLLIPYGPPRVDRMFLRLQRSSSTSAYYLPEAEGQEGCPPAERVQVRPWWSATEVSVCRKSYRPEVSFDDMGYCAGRPEPRLRQPARASCGCGPFLLACLPPQAEAQAVERALNDGLYQEVMQTAVELLSRGAGYDALLTTTETWQTGAVRFLYRRREWLGELERTGYTPTLAQRLARELDAVDLDAPGAWVTRTGVYERAGLFVSTPLNETAYPTHRVAMKELLKNFLCNTFSSVEVTSHALLTAAPDSSDLRAFRDLGDTQMSRAPACQGCHKPLDHGAAFLAGLKTPLYGASPSGTSMKGRLYIHGAEDLRGEGEGFADLGRLVTQQPEFDTCAVTQLVASLVHRAPSSFDAGERALLDRWAREFKQQGRGVKWLLHAALLSDRFVPPLSGLQAP